MKVSQASFSFHFILASKNLIDQSNLVHQFYLVFFASKNKYADIGRQNSNYFEYIKKKSQTVTLADPKGAPGTRAPPGGPNSFIFMQFSAKIINKHTHFGSWRPPWGKS